MPHATWYYAFLLALSTAAPHEPSRSALERPGPRPQKKVGIDAFDPLV